MDYHPRMGSLPLLVPFVPGVATGALAAVGATNTALTAASLTGTVAGAVASAIPSIAGSVLFAAKAGFFMGFAGVYAAPVIAVGFVICKMKK